MIEEQLWQAALGEIELSLSKANFTTWFKNTFIAEKSDGKIIIGVPNGFTKAWLENKYHDDWIYCYAQVANSDEIDDFILPKQMEISHRQQHHKTQDYS